MNEWELLEFVLEESKKITYKSSTNFKVINARAEILVRKIFGDKSHYLADLKNIGYSPSIITSDSTSGEWKTAFEDGIKQFNNLLLMMIKEMKLSSNYNNPKTQEFIDMSSKKMPSKEPKEIKVVIASPSDAVIERELLMDKLETQFRRDGYEETCGARILVSGWENVASQSGYAQDIINEALIEKADIIIAVFRHKLGSPVIDTKTSKFRADSGTAEEILFAIKNQTVENPPLGMAYFYGIAPVLSLDSIEFEKVRNEWERLRKFKDSIKDNILYKQYNKEQDIINIVCKDLNANIKQHFSNR